MLAKIDGILIKFNIIEVENDNVYFKFTRDGNFIFKSKTKEDNINIEYIKLEKDKYSENDIINIYTDGCCINNHTKNEKRKMGIGVYILDENENEIRSISKYIFDENPTNNRAELYGIIEAMKITHNWKEQIIIHTDSQYVANTINKNWKKKKNTDLWKQIYKYLEIKKFKVKWIPRENNEIADRLSKEACY
uniref:ribonuclease H n=1 Tax=Pithovirus LCDPAC02 TaxID=2506601 RepID=A0A481YP03_9VIRU|nr:MAG: ribonuclease H [Pithovirus LCDPAC02]